MKIYNEQHIGETHVSNEGYEIVVVKGSDKPGHVVVNIDGKYDDTVEYSDLVDGKVKNPYHKSFYGKGYIGIGKHKVSIKCERTMKYIAWSEMLQRCYSSDYHQEYPAYKDVTVCDEWLNFQVFGDWYDEQYKKKWWQLNKDLLGRGKKIYSPDTCVFIPIELNLLLSQDTENKDHRLGIRRVRSGYRSRSYCSISGRYLDLGTYDTIEEADLVYRNNRLGNMMFWLRYQHIGHRAYEGLKIIYEEYKKEKDDLEERIASEQSANN